MKTRWVIGCALVAMVGVAAADKAKPAKNDKTKTDAKAPPAEAEAPAAGSAEAAAAPEPALPAHIEGPKLVELGHHVQLELPAGMALFERAQAIELMKKGGNDTEHVVAVVAPMSDTSSWWAAVEAWDEGYVDDSDADDLDADELRNQIRDSTNEQNKVRAQQGIDPLYVDDWSEKPHYDRATHHLIWSLNAHDKDGKSVNYSTRFLGRNGFISINVVDGFDTMAKSKTEAAQLLAALHFTPGFRYEDHTSGDRDSGIGLKGLILGGTAVVLAKKGGILIAILLALKKGVIVIVVAIGAFLKRLFGGKKKDEAIAMSTPPAAAPPHDEGPPPGPDAP